MKKRTKKIHKYYRSTKTDQQFRLCDDKRVIFAENVSWFWKNVTCPKCLKLKGVK